MHRFLGFPRPPHGRTHRFLAVGVKAEYVAEAWRRGEEEGFETVHQLMHQLAEAQTDLATVRDAMEATDEALARKEQEAAYMVDGEI